MGLKIIFFGSSDYAIVKVAILFEKFIVGWVWFFKFFREEEVFPTTRSKNSNRHPRFNFVKVAVKVLCGKWKINVNKTVECAVKVSISCLGAISFVDYMRPIVIRKSALEAIDIV